jgi:hypothetical protein
LLAAGVEDAALADQHLAIAIGRRHADRLLDHGAVVIAPVAADHQMLPGARSTTSNVAWMKFSA